MKKIVLVIIVILVIAGVAFVVKPELFKGQKESPSNVGSTPEQTITKDLLSKEPKLVSEVKLTADQQKLYEEGVAEFAKKAAPIAKEQDVKIKELTKAKSPDVEKVAAKYATQLGDAYGTAMQKFSSSLSKEQVAKLNEFYAAQAKDAKK